MNRALPAKHIDWCKARVAVLALCAGSCSDDGSSIIEPMAGAGGTSGSGAGSPPTAGAGGAANAGGSGGGASNGGATGGGSQTVGGAGGGLHSTGGVSGGGSSGGGSGGLSNGGSAGSFSGGGGAGGSDTSSNGGAGGSDTSSNGGAGGSDTSSNGGGASGTGATSDDAGAGDGGVETSAPDAGAGSMEDAGSTMEPTSEDSGAAVNNLLSNSDFESGVDGWTAAFGGTIEATQAQAHGGSWSARVTDRSDTYQGAFVDITSLVVPAGQYRASVFVRIEGVDSNSVLLTTRQNCNGDQYYQNLDTSTATDSDWIQLMGDFTVRSSGECPSSSEMLLYVEGPAPGVDLLVDDAVLWTLE